MRSDPIQIASPDWSLEPLEQHIEECIGTASYVCGV